MLINSINIKNEVVNYYKIKTINKNEGLIDSPTALLIARLRITLLLRFYIYNNRNDDEIWLNCIYIQVITFKINVKG